MVWCKIGFPSSFFFYLGQHGLGGKQVGKINGLVWFGVAAILNWLGFESILDFWCQTIAYHGLANGLDPMEMIGL